MRLLDLTFEDLKQVFAECYGKGPFLAAALYREFYKNLNPAAWQAPAIQASSGLAAKLARDLVFAPGTLVDEVRREGVVKFVTRLEDDQCIESVLLPMETHHTLCVSSQVGCRMGCRFCETARMGLVRQLSIEEIVGQVYTARRRYGGNVRNVVFMGMGEPFDNYDHVIQAVRVLSDQRGLDIAQRYITVSTAGRIDGIAKLARQGMPHLKLAVSLNAAEDNLRDRLMPLNRSAPLDRLQEALAAYPLKKGYDLMVAYVLMPGINDGDEQLAALTRWLAPLRAKVNLIPFNPGRSSANRPPTDAELERFRQQLIDAGVNVQKRAPRGRDLMAACGQLGGRLRCAGSGC
ncbi:MAG: 23S rRNA (adenine(2503)-C(2))-methyltransferase RlmN [Desulfobacterales bacterium]|nr:23S rRNA (adenine(2503)-C(2))-methyltransferase RlmN [Desulfobacterales bacterium]